MPHISKLLNFVEAQTGRKFLVAPMKNAPHSLQFPYEASRFNNKPLAFFSNRPHRLGAKFRDKATLPASERFLRLDMEMDDHSTISLDSTERSLVVEWAKSISACGVLHTRRGTHVYLLASEEFPWSDAKMICLGLQKQYHDFGGKMIICDASWAVTNWSQSGEFSNYSLAHNTPTTTHSYTLYYGTNRIDKEEVVSQVKSSTYVTKRRNGSRQESTEEFSMVYSKLASGISFEIATQNLSFHTPNDIAKALQDPAYQLKYRYNAVPTQKPTEKPVEPDKTTRDSPFGAMSMSRTIQRDFSPWGNLCHSLSLLPLQKMTNEFAIKEMHSDNRFYSVLKDTKNRYGKDYKEIIFKALDRARSFNGLGNYQVSIVLLNLCESFLKQHKSFTRNDLEVYLLKEAPQAKFKWVKRGTSKRHIIRIINTLLESKSIEKVGGGRSTKYATITKQPLENETLQANSKRYLPNADRNHQSDSARVRELTLHPNAGGVTIRHNVRCYTLHQPTPGECEGSRDKHIIERDNWMGLDR